MEIEIEVHGYLHNSGYSAGLRAGWGAGGRGGRVRGRGREGKAGARGRNTCGSLDSRTRARARALWVRSPYYECNVWGYAVLPEWTSVVVPAAMLIKYG